MSKTRLKSKTTLILFIVLSFLLNSIVYAEDSSNTEQIKSIIESGTILKINNTVSFSKTSNINLDVPPQIIGNKTLVPARFLAENFGCKVNYQNGVCTLVTSDNANVIIKIGEKRVLINGKTITLDSPATVIKGRLMLPLKFVAETVLNKKVHWDNRGIILITDKDIVLDSGTLTGVMNQIDNSYKDKSSIKVTNTPEPTPTHTPTPKYTPAPTHTPTPDTPSPAPTYNLNPNNSNNLPFGVVFDGGEHVFKDTSDKTVAFNSQPQKDPNNPDITFVKSSATITTPSLRDDVQIWCMPDSGIEGVRFGTSDPVNGIISINAYFDIDFINKKPSGEYKGVVVCNCISKGWRVVERVTFNVTVIKE